MDTSVPPISTTGQRTRFAPVYAVLEQAVANRVFPGCAFGVLAPGAEGGCLPDAEGAPMVCALDAVGRQTYALDAPLIQPDTMYDLASVSKVLATTAMAMLLHQRGALVLDQPLVEILPAFAESKGGDAPRSSVTLRQLLAHASGLAGYARLFEDVNNADALLEACLHMPLLHAPGTHAEYSDIGFILLGRALETIAGEPLDSFCQREIFTPLAMQDTGYCPAPELRPNIPPTEDDAAFRHRVLQGEVQDENCFVLGGVSGHAGLFGTVHDLLRFAAAVLASRGKPCSSRSKALFHPDTLRLFATRAELPPGSSRALGWDTPSATSLSEVSSAGEMFSANSIGHLGYAGTSLWIDLEAGVAVALLTNRTWPDRLNQAIRVVRPAFHDAVRACLRNGSAEAGYRYSTNGP